MLLWEYSARCFCCPAVPGEETPEIPETEIWETAPVLTYGVMTYEKLEILPWYAGRAEAVKRNYCAETELSMYSRWIR